MFLIVASALTVLVVGLAEVGTCLMLVDSASSLIIAQPSLTVGVARPQRVASHAVQVIRK